MFNQSINYMKSKSFLAKAFLMLLAVLFSLTGARAQETFTVYEDAESTSSKVPVYGLWADSYLKCEYVIAAAELEPMTGATISNMTFYVGNLASEAWAGTFQVFLKEVESETISSFYGTDGATLVYEGTLDATAQTMSVEFSESYVYGGGNLLVGVYLITPGNYKSASFIGAEVEGACVQGYKSSSLDDVEPTQQNFIPKTTFTYTPGGGVVYPKPTDLTVSDLTTNSVTISWTEPEGKVDGYAYQYKKAKDEEWSTEATVVDPTVALTDLTSGTPYNFRVKAIYGEDASSYASINFTTDCDVVSIPFEEDFSGAITCWTLTDCHSQTGLSGGTFAFHYSTTPPQYLISPEFNATTAIMVSFYYLIQNTAWPETFQVGYSSTTRDVDAFTWKDEVTATNASEWLKYEAECPAGTKFVAIRYNSNDKYYLYVTNFSIEESNGLFTPTDLAVSEIGNKSAKLSWTENGTATAWQVRLYSGEEEVSIINADSNPFTLEGLTPETNYIVRVRAIDGENTGEWSNAVSFTTDVAFPAPTELAAEPAGKSATITWTGTADSYNLRYRAIAEGSVLFSDDFEDGLDNWTIYTEGEAPQEVGWYTIDPSSGLSFTAYSGSACASSWSWNGSAYNADNWLVTPKVAFGGRLTFYVRTNSGYPDSYAVLLSTTGNATTDFTETLQEMAAAPTNGEWNEVSIDLSAYAGQEGYIAFHHVSNDANYLVIDDVTISGGSGETIEWITVNDVTSPYTIEGLDPETKYEVEVQAVYADGESVWAATSFTTLEEVPTPSDLAASDVTFNSAVLSWTENGEATAWQIALNGDEENLIAADSNPFTLEGLTPETEYTAVVRAVNGEKTSKWSNEVSFTTDIQFQAPTELAAEPTTTTATITWTGNEEATGYVLEYAEGASETDWYKYDNGTYASALGISAEFSCAAMFPAGSFTGSTLSYVRLYDASAAEAIVTIYSGGDAEPEGTALASENVTLTGADTPVDVNFDVTIDPTKNVWVVVTLPSGGYYAVATDELGDANGRWSNLGSGWVDLASVGGTGYCWMIGAEIGTVVDPSTLTWVTIDGATSPAELTGLNPETSYTVRVKAIYADGESKYTETTFTTLSENPVPYNIAADLAADGATLTWEGQGDSYVVRYRTVAEKNYVYLEDFENLTNGALPEGWTAVDNDGDGNNWSTHTNTGSGNFSTHSGNGVAISASYDNGALTPDNWLISPQLDLKGTLSVWMRGQDAGWASEHFAIYLSTEATIADVSDFTIELVPETITTGDYVEYTADLSAYEGQQGYIAIRHFNVTDMFWLDLDDFSIYEDIPAGEWQTIATNDLTATISGLETNSLYEYQIQSVKGESESEWSALDEFALVTLDCNGDNSDLISKFEGKYAHVTLANRTLYQDGTWNTIYLPFDMSVEEFEASPLGGADIRTLSNSTMEGNTVTLNFIPDAVNAWKQYYGGVAYIVKWTSGSGIENPAFANVTITTNEYYTGDDEGDVMVQFYGTYDTYQFEEDYNSILFIGADNKLNYPLAGATIGATRGYFLLEGVTAGEESGVKFFTNLGDEDPTGIANINAEEGGDWYDISGRKLAGKPSMKGIYVNGGRKVTVK